MVTLTFIVSAPGTPATLIVTPDEGGAAFDAVGVAVDPGDDGLGELELYALHDDSRVLPQKPSNNFC